MKSLKLFNPPRGMENRYYRYYVFITIGYTASFIVHGWNVALFSWLDVRPLVIHNVASMALFAAVIALNRRGLFFTALAMAIIEFLSHAVFVTRYIGWGSGYTHYLFFMAVTAYLAPAGKKALKASLVAASCVTYIALYYYSALYAPVYPISPDVLQAMNVGNVVAIFFLLGVLAYYYRNAADVAEEALEREYRRSEDLLHNILPEEIAGELKGGGTIARRHDECTVVFADMVGFTPLAERTTPERLVEILNELFSAFDDLVELHGIEKIKTIGDSYMIVAGAPYAREDHAAAAVRCALDMVRATAEFSARRGLDLRIRVGVNSGPAIAGVIGKKKFTYDLWGDTVNLASRMEYHGVPGEVQVSENTRRLLGEGYEFVHRGMIEVKGKGEVNAYIVKQVGGGTR